MKKISLFLCVALLFTMLGAFHVSAVEMPDFYVKDTTVTPGENVTIEVGVTGLSATKAMDTFGVTLTYPEGFTYVADSAVATAKVKDVCKLTIGGDDQQAYWIEHDASARTITLVAVVNTVTLATAGITEDGILMTAQFTSPAAADFAATGYKFNASALESGFIDLTGETVEVTVTDGNVTKTVTVLKGDISGDNLVKDNDRTLIARYLAGWTSVNFTADQMLAADVSGDGEIKDNDRTLLARYLAGWTSVVETW